MLAPKKGGQHHDIGRENCIRPERKRHDPGNAGRAAGGNTAGCGKVGNRESSSRHSQPVYAAAAAILLWFALPFVGLGAAVGLLLLLLILMIVLFLIAIGKSGIVAAAKSTGKRMLYLIAAMLLALVLWSVAFVA